MIVLCHIMSRLSQSESQIRDTHSAWWVLCLWVGYYFSHPQALLVLIKKYSSAGAIYAENKYHDILPFTVWVWLSNIAAKQQFYTDITLGMIMKIQKRVLKSSLLCMQKRARSNILNQWKKLTSRCCSIASLYVNQCLANLQLYCTYDARLHTVHAMNNWTYHGTYHSGSYFLVEIIPAGYCVMEWEIKPMHYFHSFIPGADSEKYSLWLLHRLHATS